MKVLINEEQFKIYVKNKLMESIVSEKNTNKKNISKYARGKVDNIINYMSDLAKNGNPGLLKRAKENGINIDALSGKITPEEYNSEFERKIQELLDEKNNVINEWVKTWLQPLRKCYVEDTKNFKKGVETYNSYQNTLNTPVLDFDKLSDNEKTNIINLRDFLDKEGLSFIYRPAEKVSYITKKFGVDIANVDYNTNVNDINIDFGNVSDKEIENYYEGSRIKRINQQLQNLGFDVNNTKVIGTDVWNAEGGGKDIAKKGLLYKTASRYIQRTYGLDFNFGKNNNIFSFGNSKINNDTLIINFTSAMRCPAWNLCLLKDACYAKTTEEHYDGSFNKNQRSNLIWSQTEEDPILMNMMLELIRASMIDYKNLNKKIERKEPSLFDGIDNIYEARKNIKQYLTIDELSKMSFTEIRNNYGEDVINLIKKNRKGSYIRLNEDGDFIGQWLVDAWEEWAKDFKIVDINVVAYTCRALNYNKIRNMILNISQENLVRGQNPQAFAHYFYAVEPETYDNFNETYNGNNFNLYIDPKNGKITPIYRNLIDENGELVGYYYKCPCGRGKFRYEKIDINNISSEIKKNISNAVEIRNINDAREDSPNLAIYDGEYYKKVKNNNLEEKADCYRCRICYGRDIEGDIIAENGKKPLENLPVYVLVSAHGSNKDSFIEGFGNRNILGKKPEEWVRLQKSGIKQKENSEEYLVPQPAINEENMNNSQQEDPIAINQIVKNTVYSVANMMQKNDMMIKEQKDKFYDFFNKLK